MQSQTTIYKECQRGLSLVSLAHPLLREFHYSVTPLGDESVADMFARLSQALQASGAAVVKQDVFGPVALHAQSMDALKASMGGVDWPVTWVEGSCCGSGPLCGTQVFAVAGTPVRTVLFEERPIGRVFHDGAARYAFFGDIRPTDTAGDRTTQAWQTYQNLTAALDAAGMQLPNLVRTWLFLDDILGWYGPFNTARTTFFNEHKVFDNLLPASTGVGGRNPAGAALCADAFALDCPDGLVTAREIASPLQCPAPRYGSSFSRAIEIAGPDYRRILVSGTASIAPEGTTTHAGNLDGQIAVTMDVIHAILQSRGMDWGDVSRAIAYFKVAADAPALARYCTRRKLPAIPVIATCCDVCRDDLLFELELDAIRPA